MLMSLVSCFISFYFFVWLDPTCQALRAKRSKRLRSPKAGLAASMNIGLKSQAKW